MDICDQEAPSVSVGQRHLGSLSHREGEDNMESLGRSWGDLQARVAGVGWAGCVGEASPRESVGWVMGRKKDLFPDHVTLEMDSVVERVLRWSP